MDKNGLRTPFLYKSLWTQVGWSIWWPRFFRILDELQKDHFENHKSPWIAKFWSVIFWGDDPKGKKQSGWTWKALEHREQILASFWKLERSFKSSPNRITKNRQVPPEWNGSSPPSSCPRNQTLINHRPKMNDFSREKEPFLQGKCIFHPSFFRGICSFSGGSLFDFWVLPQQKNKKNPPSIHQKRPRTERIEIRIHLRSNDELSHLKLDLGTEGSFR